MAERERFSSRFGFILISAGCAIGLGNIWRFPYVVGKNGGAIFVLFYLLFLVILGLPIMIMEFSVGRSSQKSVALSFKLLEPKGTKWHYYSYFAMIGNYLLMMFYTTVAGWMIAYFFKMVKGDFVNLSTEEVGNVFTDFIASPSQVVFWLVVVILISFLVCSLGLKNGVEKVTKSMILCLLFIIIILVVKSLSLPNAIEGIKFYLVPDFKKVHEIGLGIIL